MAIAPSHMGHAMAGNNLHVLGMWANFAISAAIISYFVSQIANELESQQKKIAEHREQQLENEQLLAIGTLAAGTAHELGTPLNTMRLLVDEMQLQQTANKDINLLSQQIDQCKITLMQLQSTANESSANQYADQTLHSYFDQLIERWHLMRPELNAKCQLR
jgi:two-component system sensor histidine kinase RegB